MQVIYHPAAQAELLEAAQFYEDRSPGLGVRFLHEFDDAIADIGNSPKLWPIVEGDLRCRTMTRFPFAVYYRFIDERLQILVVKHHSRHPDYWRNRLDD